MSNNRQNILFTCQIQFHKECLRLQVKTVDTQLWTLKNSFAVVYLVMPLYLKQNIHQNQWVVRVFKWQHWSHLQCRLCYFNLTVMKLRCFPRLQWFCDDWTSTASMYPLCSTWIDIWITTTLAHKHTMLYTTLVVLQAQCVFNVFPGATS